MHLGSCHHSALLLLATAAAASGACRQPAKPDTRAPGPATTQAADAQPQSRHWEISRPAPATQSTVAGRLPPPAQPTLVRQGRLPLVHMLEADGVVLVMDLASGEQIVRIAAPARSIVAVDAARGVSLNGQRLVAGPLSSERAFGLYVQPPDTAAESVIRRGTVRPGGRSPQP